MSFPSDMPEPKFEGQEIVWAREYPIEVGFSDGPPELNVIENKVKKVEFRYKAYRLCKGGKLRWEKIASTNIH